jgi:hypothetical protein
MRKLEVKKKKKKKNWLTIIHPERMTWVTKDEEKKYNIPIETYRENICYKWNTSDVTK